MVTMVDDTMVDVAMDEQLAISPQRGVRFLVLYICIIVCSAPPPSHLE